MRNWVVPAASLLGAGWFFATCIIVGVLLGRWGDSQLGIDPVLTLVGIFLGLAVAFVGGYRMLRPLLGQSEVESSGKG
jgi:hypothetical protein